MYKFTAAMAVAIAIGLSVASAGNEDAAIKTVIGDKTPLFHKCYEHARDGDISVEALVPCNRSIEEEDLTRRKKAILYANRGVIQFNIGDYEAAVDDFTLALDNNIHVQARLYANRGLSFEALGYDALARADYHAALAVNPDNAVALRRLEELQKPLYDRSRPPRRITADAVGA
jgi:tetratricopeptide (TPR) repeat protein